VPCVFSPNSHKIKRRADYDMSELDWDDPKYVEAPVKGQEYSKMNDKYERSLRRDDNSRGYGGDRKRDDNRGNRDDYGGGRRDNRGNRDDHGGGGRRDNRDSRDNYGGGGGRGFSESLSIASEMIGKVIGRAGANISRIQTDFDVYVKVDKIELIVNITGKVQSNVSDAINHVRKQVTSDPGNRGRDQDRRGSFGGGGYGGGGGGHGKSKGSSYEFNPPASRPTTDEGGDLTGSIDWASINKASVSRNTYKYNR